MMSYWMDVPNMMGANQKCWSSGRVTSTNGQNGPRNEQSRSSVNRNQQFRDVCRMWKKTSDQPNNLSLRSHDNPQTLLAQNKPRCQNSTDEERRWLELSLVTANMEKTKNKWTAFKSFFLLNTQSAAIQTTFTSSHCIYYSRNTAHYRREAPVMLGPVSEWNHWLSD